MDAQDHNCIRFSYLVAGPSPAPTTHPPKLFPINVVCFQAPCSLLQATNRGNVSRTFLFLSFLPFTSPHIHTHSHPRITLYFDFFLFLGMASFLHPWDALTFLSFFFFKKKKTGLPHTPLEHTETLFGKNKAKKKKKEHPIAIRSQEFHSGSNEAAL